MKETLKYCFYNNVALAAKHYKLRLKRYVVPLFLNFTPLRVEFMRQPGHHKMKAEPCGYCF